MQENNISQNKSDSAKSDSGKSSIIKYIIEATAIAIAAASLVVACFTLQKSDDMLRKADEQLSSSVEQSNLAKDLLEASGAQLEVAKEQLSAAQKLVRITSANNTPYFLLSNIVTEETGERTYRFENIGGRSTASGIHVADCLFVCLSEESADGDLRIVYWYIENRYEPGVLTGSEGSQVISITENNGGLDMQYVMDELHNRLGNVTDIFHYVHVHPMTWSTEEEVIVDDYYIKDGNPGYDEQYRDLLNESSPGMEDGVAIDAEEVNSDALINMIIKSVN